MEISKLLELFSNDGLTCAERVEFSESKVNRLNININININIIFLKRS